MLYVQETRWKGNKAKYLVGGCKLLRSSANRQGRNGVGIVLSNALKEDLISVSRRSDRLMSISLGVEDTVVNNTCGYAPSGMYRGGKINVLGLDGSRAECDIGG